MQEKNSKLNPSVNGPSFLSSNHRVKLDKQRECVAIPLCPKESTQLSVFMYLGAQAQRGVEHEYLNEANNDNNHLAGMFTCAM